MNAYIKWRLSECRQNSQNFFLNDLMQENSNQKVNQTLFSEIWQYNTKTIATVVLNCLDLTKLQTKFKFILAKKYFENENNISFFVVCKVTFDLLSTAISNISTNILLNSVSHTLLF